MIKKLIDRLLGKPARKAAPAASEPEIPVVPLGQRVEVPRSGHRHRPDAGR